jgi:hypothetical protein
VVSDVAWIRISRSCQNACLFCAESASLDGAPVPPETVEAAIDAAAAAGARKVVLSGGEPTLSKGLLRIVKHAKARGLVVSLTTNGRVLQTERHVEMLKAAGLDEIAVSVHAGRRSTHDVLVGREGAWVESLQALRVAGRGGLRTVLKTVITAGNEAELLHLQHLGTMAGIAEMEVRWLQPAGRALDPAHADAIALAPRLALKLLDALWFQAKEEVTLLTAAGFDDTVDAPFTDDPSPRRQIDGAALRLLRQRVDLASARSGFSLLDGDGLAKDLVAASELAGGLDALGLEVAARGAPIGDAPFCVGGRSDRGTDAFPDGVFEGPGCATCPMRPGCGRLPRKLAKLGAAIAPLPGWSPIAGPVAVVAGGDPAIDAVVLPALVEALRAEGLDASLAAPEDARDAATVILGGPGPLAALGRDAFVGRVVALDTAEDAGAFGGLRGDDVVVSHLPGRPERFARRLRHVVWRPFPAPPAWAAAGPGAGVAVVGPRAEAVAASLAGAPGGARPVSDGVAVAGAAVVVLAPEGPMDPTTARWASVAAAAGRPIVAARGRGVEDLVRHDRTGVLVTRGSVAALSEAVARLVGNADAAARLGAGARAAFSAGTVATWARELVVGARPASTAPGAPERPFPAF